MAVFFILEKALRFPHLHAHTAGHRQCEENQKNVLPSAPLILIGDALHNFVDGVLIATAFSVSVPLGITTSFAVIAHEIPQELGDFVILIESGMERWKAYWMNFLSALGTLVGALCTVWLGASIERFVPYILAISAASFLHIATVDLAPVLHHKANMKSSLRQTLGFLVGIGTIFVLHHFVTD
ncbi:MAG: ZIP family metal transporter [Xanthomonadaceae bacterium]|nr:ZIP family metal transporter [Xanthomonadaceae bacterium]